MVAHCLSAEDWTGPENQVDVISLIHCLYHVVDLPGLLNSCMAWLKPGGRILIIIVDENAVEKDLRSRYHSSVCLSEHVT